MNESLVYYRPPLVTRTSLERVKLWRLTNFKCFQSGVIMTSDSAGQIELTSVQIV